MDGSAHALNDDQICAHCSVRECIWHTSEIQAWAALPIARHIQPRIPADTGVAVVYVKYFPRHPEHRVYIAQAGRQLWSNQRRQDVTKQQLFDGRPKKRLRKGTPACGIHSRSNRFKQEAQTDLVPFCTRDRTGESSLGRSAPALSPRSRQICHSLPSFQKCCGHSLACPQ